MLVEPVVEPIEPVVEPIELCKLVERVELVGLVEPVEPCKINVTDQAQCPNCNKVCEY